MRLGNGLFSGLHTLHGCLGVVLLCSSCAAGSNSTAVTETGTNKLGISNEVSMKKQFSVSENNRKELLSIARQSIEHYLKSGSEKTFETNDPELALPAAVFVTLTQKGQLRGCIGTLEARSPLSRAVAEYAVAAAVHDSRFDPLTIAELPLTHIEVSVLSPMELVKSADEIKQNTHGVVVRRGFNSGLFLPQVWEHFSKKEDFLDELCRQKAHLPADAWKDPKTELLVFTVFAFEDPK